MKILANLSAQSVGHAFLILLVAGLVLFIVMWAIGAIGIPEPFNKGIRVLASW